MINRMPGEITGNVFERIGKQWMLITAGNADSFNTMTASWGGLGVLWGKNVATVYIRKHRYTYQFVEQSDFFTLSFLPEQYRSALQICGSESGRNGDKIKKAGLTPYAVTDQAMSFKEAELVLVCRKLYRHEINPELMIEKEIDDIYPQKDYHVLYIGEIMSVLEKEKET